MYGLWFSFHDYTYVNIRDQNQSIIKYIIFLYLKNVNHELNLLFSFTFFIKLLCLFFLGSSSVVFSSHIVHMASNLCRHCTSEEHSFRPISEKKYTWVIDLKLDDFAKFGSISSKSCLSKTCKYACNSHVIMPGSNKGFIKPFFKVRIS